MGTKKPTEIDRDKLRLALLRLRSEAVHDLLNDALDLLAAEQVAGLVGTYFELKTLRPSAKRNLLVDVRTFESESRAGKYYEGFNVNSKNYMQLSIGTRTFIAACNRLLERCVEQSITGDAAETREAIELIFGLLKHIDLGSDDVVFFADEGGSWQVGVDWENVLPAYFMCLSQTIDSDDYAQRVVDVVDAFESFRRKVHLATAKRLATPAQRQALGRLARSSIKKD